MQTTYRLNSQELSINFIKSLKSLFVNQEIEVIVRPVPDPSQIKDSDWVLQTNSSPSFDFLNDEAEDIYTIFDGKPLNNEK
jgi:hypothetical protein